MTNTTFPALTGNPVYYRTYSRFVDGNREDWAQTVDRVVAGLIKLGNLTTEESELIREEALALRMLPAGRSLWVGGTPWAEKPDNFSGNYNCSGFRITSFERMAFMMGLLMQGCGVGTTLEPECIEQLPQISCAIDLKIVGEPGDLDPIKQTQVVNDTIIIGDSRQGWIDAYLAVLEISASPEAYRRVVIELGRIRAAGAKIKGFGGVSNPVGLPRMFTQMVKILNGAVGRRLNSFEVCLLLDEASVAVVSGNVRRSANWRGFSSEDNLAATAKDNLWIETDGIWSIDPDRDALRMGNHTRIFHYKPSLTDCVEAVIKQYHSGEGAIMWAGEAVARANADLLKTDADRRNFIDEYNDNRVYGEDYLKYKNDSLMPIDEIEHRMNRYTMNPCGEIISNNFMCNLSDVHLNQFSDCLDLEAQSRSFKAAAITVSTLLHHKFVDAEQQFSRELDPIVGVSFTGLFDFFVNAFGIDWLKWWAEGRSQAFELSDEGLVKVESIADLFGIDIADLWYEGDIYRALESAYLNYWRGIVEENVGIYCAKHGLKVPNRSTTVQPSGTKSLLTGASPGWHPPKAAHFIRRITFGRENPVAMACLDYGYSVIPSQTDKDEHGNLLDDPFDPRCTEWLVEIPISTNWADLEGADNIDISQFSALAQFDFYMGVQQNYTRHNTSATIEFQEHEIEPLGTAIYKAIQKDSGYISAALLARFDGVGTFPRLPFEPIDKATYDRLVADVATRSEGDDFGAFMAKYDAGDLTPNAETAGCDSDKCLMPDLSQKA
jgi:ribonucleotide reductase, class II